MSDLPVDPALTEPALLGLEYGIDLVSDHRSEAFQPALITTNDAGERGITQLMAVGMRIDDVFGFACERLKAIPGVAAAVVVMDGSVEVGKAAEDAVIARVGTPAARHSSEFFQRYRRTGFRGKRLERVGNTGYSGEGPPLFE